MTDLTDDQRRVVLGTARTILDKPYDHTAAACELASFVLANVDAPATTLSEELSNIAEHWEEWTTNTITAKLNVATDCAKQMEWELDHISTSRDNWKAHAKQNVRELTEARAELERERDEAQSKLAEVMNARDSLREDFNHERAEVERLTAERDRIANGRYITYAEIDGKPVQKGAESNAESIDPADVKPGEAWIVEVNGDTRTALKDDDELVPWSTTDDNGTIRFKSNENVTLVSRLVPAPRVITDHDELDKLAPTSIFRDGSGWPGGITDQGEIMRMNGVVLDSTELLRRGPVTVLWGPEV